MFQAKKSDSTSAPAASRVPGAGTQRQKELKGGGTSIKQLQEAALAALPRGKLYIGLWIQDDPPIANRFHWGLYYHTSKDGGTKYHVKGLGGGWIADHGTTGGVFKSNFLCVLIKIGTVSAAKGGQVDQIITSLDGSLNDIPGLTCRVWLFKIVQLLVEAQILRCSNLSALEQECLTHGNAEMVSAALNHQPRPVKVATLCS